MSDFLNDIVEVFLSNLAGLPPGEESYARIDDIMAPALAGEQLLRTLLAINHPLIPSDPHVGLINVFSVWPRPITIGRDRAADFNSRHLFPFNDSEIHPLRLPDGRPAIIPRGEFLKNWDIFTNGLLKHLDWTNVVAAGGAVLACLKSTARQDSTNLQRMNLYQSDIYSGSDIDLFLYGLSPSEAMDKMKVIEDQVNASACFPTICVRKSHTISIHTTFPSRPIQIVLRLYHSPTQILAGFDIDSACCAFDGTNVFMSPRSLAAFIRQANTINMTRRSPSYEVQLAKYARRGFEIYLPDLRREDIDHTSEIFSPHRTNFPSGLARLLILERMLVSPESYPRLTYPGKRTNLNIKDSVAEEGIEVDLAAISLAPSNYDFSWRELPYGSGWDALRIRSLVERLDTKMNRLNEFMNVGRRLHCHAIFAGNMASCLGRFCETCPAPETDEEKELLERESATRIYGPVRFLETNPGQQLIGSFNPINSGDWAAEAYQ